MATATPHIFGIRHHGPGSARSLRLALEELQPDIILVEGPPDAEAVLPLLAHEKMQPPVAILVYAPEQPNLAAYYPFAKFSPEWQALDYALKTNIQARFMDLPQSHRLSLMAQPEPEKPPTEEGETQVNEEQVAEIKMPPPRIDPLRWLSEAAGYSDSERWWEKMVEHRHDSAGLFQGIMEAMAAMREAAPPEEELIERQREAHMRQTIRAAQKEGFEKIAVVCGAWHAPALADMPPEKEDAALLKGLGKMKVAATWVPWTYGRLAYDSGYGAGVESPGWYDHLWNAPGQPLIRWLTKVAHLLREEGLDVSPAHVIEATRLAETLAALRENPLPGLPEIDEAIQAIFCFGSDLPMKLIHQKLVVGERLGQIPDETPMVPLQQDLTREQKRLRMKVEAFQETLELDLRKPNDRDKSLLLYRLSLLGILWGKKDRSSGGKGTFKETWKTQWQPEFAVTIITAAVWGNTVYSAATNYVKDAAAKSTSLPQLTGMVELALNSDLPEAVEFLMARVQAEAAISADVAHLMEALPPLVNVLRYGNVRQTDTAAVAGVVDGLIKRVCIGLPGACSSLNDDAAEVYYKLLLEVNSAIAILQNEEHTNTWQATLKQLADRQGLHGLLGGRSVRLLLDAGVYTSEEGARRMGLALSAAGDPAQAAAWVEGFLKGSGLLLLHDEALWQVLDEWVVQLNDDNFVSSLPLLRRTFSTFASPERRQMGEIVKRGQTKPGQSGPSEFDRERAELVLPLVAQLLGIAPITNQEQG